MISLYSGTPGSGKSLHTAKEMRDRAILGKPTICNFEVNVSKYKRAAFEYVPNDALTPEYLISYSQNWFQNHRFKEGTILLVIDECQLLFNAREWQQSGRAQWLSFFTQHRKYGYNVILIAQFDRMIDRQIRSLIEYEFIHRKASNFGIGGMIFSLVSGGNLFVTVQMWYPLKARIGSEFFHARKKYWEMYDSYATFATDGGTEGAQGSPSAPPPVRKRRQGNKGIILLRSSASNIIGCRVQPMNAFGLPPTKYWFCFVWLYGRRFPWHLPFLLIPDAWKNASGIFLSF